MWELIFPVKPQLPVNMSHDGEIIILLWERIQIKRKLCHESVNCPDGTTGHSPNSSAIKLNNNLCVSCLQKLLCQLGGY